MGKKSRIEKLQKSKTLKLNWNDDTSPYSLNPESANTFLHDEYQGKSFKNDDTGESYVLSKRERKKLLLSHNRYSEAHMKALLFLPEIIKNSIFIADCA